MRILFVHPNYRSGGAEIAGTWPPAWVAYLSGPLKRAGFDDITFIDEFFTLGRDPDYWTTTIAFTATIAHSPPVARRKAAVP